VRIFKICFLFILATTCNLHMVFMVHFQSYLANLSKHLAFLWYLFPLRYETSFFLFFVPLILLQIMQWSSHIYMLALTLVTVYPFKNFFPSLLLKEIPDHVNFLLWPNWLTQFLNWVDICLLKEQSLPLSNWKQNISLLMCLLKGNLYYVHISAEGFFAMEL